MWHPEDADAFETVTSMEAHDMARRLARERAIFAGASTGANVVAALRVAQRLGPNRSVVTIAVDSGLKYLSTEVFGGMSAHAPVRPTPPHRHGRCDHTRRQQPAVDCLSDQYRPSHNRINVHAQLCPPCSSQLASDTGHAPQPRPPVPVRRARAVLSLANRARSSSRRTPRSPTTSTRGASPATVLTSATPVTSDAGQVKTATRAKPLP